MFFAYPANAILQKFRVGRCLAIACVGWGASVTLIAASPNFAVLMFLRFVMGATESFVFPCMTILISMWYTKREQPLRSAITFTSFSTVRTCMILAPFRLLTFSACLWNSVLRDWECGYRHCSLEVAIHHLGWTDDVVGDYPCFPCP